MNKDDSEIVKIKMGTTQEAMKHLTLEEQDEAVTTLVELARWQDWEVGESYSLDFSKGDVLFRVALNWLDDGTPNGSKEGWIGLQHEIGDSVDRSYGLNDPIGKLPIEKLPPGTNDFQISV